MTGGIITVVAVVDETVGSTSGGGGGTDTEEEGKFNDEIARGIDERPGGTLVVLSANGLSTKLEGGNSMSGFKEG